MWVWLTVFSALLLGLYDVAKKDALKRNDVLWILAVASALSSVFLIPFITMGDWTSHTRIMLKAVLVTTSWVSGLYGMKSLPITTVSTLKASRPMVVVVFSVLLFGERLNLYQWIGVFLVAGAIYFLGRSSNKEGYAVKSNKGFLWMLLSILTGAASALYDKHIIQGLSLDTFFVQGWGNIYITLILALLLLLQRLVDKNNYTPLKWDWTLVLIAVFITVADALYFRALNVDGAMLSVISMVRRSSVLVTFVFGAIYFKEKKIKNKLIELAILLVGVSLLAFTS